MPLDHRARKRFEGFTETLAKNGVEIVDQEFYSGGSALAKGREMTEAILKRTPDLDFLYYSNDHDRRRAGCCICWRRASTFPVRSGLPGSTASNLLKGLPKELATMDACRLETGRKAAQIIAARVNGEASGPERVAMEPKVSFGQTLRRP